jgi:dTDP-4-dehydrorhamnose reductase
VIETPLRAFDLTDEPALAAALEAADPDVIIHAAALSSADAVYRDTERGWAVNVGTTAALAAWACRHGRRLILTSTDLVFDGSRSWYREEDPPHPILEYGRTKLAAEAHVLASPGGLVARISLLYGPAAGGSPGFFDRALDGLRAGIPQAFFRDELRTPLDYHTAAEILVRLAESEYAGVIHVGGAQRLSRFDLMCEAARALGIDPVLVQSNLRADVASLEPRPADVSLATERLGRLLPDVERPGIAQTLADLMRSR